MCTSSLTALICSAPVDRPPGVGHSTIHGALRRGRTRPVFPTPLWADLFSDETVAIGGSYNPTLRKNSSVWPKLPFCSLVKLKSHLLAGWLRLYSAWSSGILQANLTATWDHLVVSLWWVLPKQFTSILLNDTWLRLVKGEFYRRFCHSLDKIATQVIKEWANIFSVHINLSLTSATVQLIQICTWQKPMRNT